MELSMKGDNEIQDFDSLANLFSFLQLNIQTVKFPARFYINQGNCRTNMDFGSGISGIQNPKSFVCEHPKLETTK